MSVGDGLAVVFSLDGTVEVLAVGVEDELVAEVVAVPTADEDTAINLIVDSCAVYKK